MVAIAIAGATGDVAKEIIDVLVAKGKHTLLLLSRKSTPAGENRPGVRWMQNDYRSTESLAATFKGVHTVLSFVDAMSDPDNIAQRTLIDASVRAGVKRFAPSEWAVSNVDDLPWYGPKAAVRKYLEDMNKDGKVEHYYRSVANGAFANQTLQVLEYTLFCPGIFTNYYTYPYPSAKHLNIFELNIDFHKRRALLLEGGDNAHISLTTVQDVAQIVAQAVDYEGEWPVMGGINGCELSAGDLVAIGEKIRGNFAIERLEAEDLRQDPPLIKSSWLPTVGHHSAPPEMWKAFVPKLIAGMLLANAAGSMKVSDEWNRLLPDYRFTSVDEFLAHAWEGKD